MVSENGGRKCRPPPPEPGGLPLDNIGKPSSHLSDAGEAPGLRNKDRGGNHRSCEHPDLEPEDHDGAKVPVGDDERSEQEHYPEEKKKDPKIEEGIREKMDPPRHEEFAKVPRLPDIE